MESFRQLLDQWGLFSERAELDIALTAADPTRYGTGTVPPSESQSLYQIRGRIFQN